jgi:hypothetical protein
MLTGLNSETGVPHRPISRPAVSRLILGVFYCEERSKSSRLDAAWWLLAAIETRNNSRVCLNVPARGSSPQLRARPHALSINSKRMTR